jgi:hypothetical protein
MKGDLQKIKKAIEERAEKIEHINEFLSDLTDFVGAKAQDIVDSANADVWDSMAGTSAFSYESKLEKSLYKLFGIEVEEEEDGN